MKLKLKMEGRADFATGDGILSFTGDKATEVPPEHVEAVKAALPVEEVKGRDK